MPRAGLSTSKVVDEGAALADEVGWQNLSLAALAQRCGVKQPSLYKHIASLDALRTEISVLALHQLGEEMTSAVLGKAGREGLVALAGAYRDYAHRHPGRYLATVAAPSGDHLGHQQAASAVLRIVEATLDGYGLTGDDAIDATRALRAALHGFVHLEASHGFGLPQDVDRSYRRLVAGIGSTMSTWADQRTVS